MKEPEASLERARFQAPSEINAEVPKDLDRAVLACLEKSLDDRLASCRELVKALNRFEAGDTETEPADPSSGDSESADESPKAAKKAAGLGCLVAFAAPLLGLLGLLLH